MLEALIARGASHRIAFVVLSAVQMVPRMQDARRRDPRGAAGAWALDEGSFVGGCASSCRSSPRSLLGSLVDVRERTFALEARGFGARPDGPPIAVADPPIDRWLRLLILAGAVAVVLVALGVVPL